MPLKHRVALGLLALATVVAATATWRSYEAIEPTRWLALHHDRNTHYALALEMAVSVQTLDAPRLVAAIDDARQWPPLHALLSASAMVVTGSLTAPVAVLPNVVAFAALALLAFDLARRLSPRTPVAAGLFAWASVLASPAHQAYATDLMLESLGAALSLLALDAWVAWRQGGNLRWVRVLGFALSALLFEKYNYYVLVIVGLVVASWLRSRGDFHHAVATALQSVRALVPNGRSTARCIAAWALAAATVCALVVAIVVMAAGGTVFELGGLRVSMRTASGPLLVAWAATLGTIALLWKPYLRDLDRSLTPAARTLLRWHGLPVAVFGLLPGRLRHFADYVSPSNTPQAAAPMLDALTSLAGWWVAHYSVHAAAVAAIAGLCVWGVVRRRDDPLIRAVAGFAVAGGLLVVLHPHHQSRFLHTWVPIVWVLGAVGLAEVARLGSSHGREQRGRWLVGVLAAVWVALHAPAFGASGHAQGDEWQPHALSSRHIAERLVAWDDPAVPTFWATRLPLHGFVGWALAEAPHAATRPPVFLPESLDSAEAFEAWLGAERPSRIGVIDLDSGSPVYRAPLHARAPVPDLVAESDALALQFDAYLPDLGVRVQIYETRPQRR